MTNRPLLAEACIGFRMTRTYMGIQRGGLFSKTNENGKGAQQQNYNVKGTDVSVACTLSALLPNANRW
jgi:hypothetical protein